MWNQLSLNNHMVESAFDHQMHPGKTTHQVKFQRGLYAGDFIWKTDELLKKRRRKDNNTSLVAQELKRRVLKL